MTVTSMWWGVFDVSCTAAGLGRHDLVKFVVDAAARYTTLTLSPKAAKLAMSRLLNAKTDYGQTALMLACKRGYSQTPSQVASNGLLKTTNVLKAMYPVASCYGWGPCIL